MRKEGPCLLWNKKAKEAQEKGFSMSMECPVSEICDGRNCLIVGGPKVPETIIYQATQNELRNTTNPLTC